MTNPPATGTLTAVIVDDEELARALMREYLSRHPDVCILAECSDGFQAVKEIDAHRPDFVILDVQMPKLSGFEVLELLDYQPAVIFATAYDEFTLKAFEVHALDYLLKPISAERFDRALEHVRSMRAGNRPRSGGTPLKNLRAREVPVQRILVKEGQQVRVILCDSIDCIQAQDDYVCITAGGKQHLKRETLGTIEEELDPTRFIRIHRSSILNIDRLARLEVYAKDSRVAILKDGTRLMVSRAGYQRLKDLL